MREINLKQQAIQELYGKLEGRSCNSDADAVRLNKLQEGLSHLSQEESRQQVRSPQESAL